MLRNKLYEKNSACSQIETIDSGQRFMENWKKLSVVNLRIVFIEKKIGPWDLKVRFYLTLLVNKNVSQFLNTYFYDGY